MINATLIELCCLRNKTQKFVNGERSAMARTVADQITEILTVAGVKRITELSVTA